MSWMQHAIIWSFLQIVYGEIKWESSETTVRVPISQLFRLDCCTGINVCGNITWYHWDVTNGSYDEFPFKWSKYLGLSRPILHGSELLVPSATFMKVGRYRCHNGDLRRSKNFTVKLCSELKVPAATPPQKFTKGRIGGDVNLQCSFNFACGKGFEPFDVYWQQMIDGMTRNVDENLVLNVQSDAPVLVDKTTYHDIRLNSTLAFKADGADFRSTYICVVNYTGSISTISKFYSTQLIEEEASDPLYSPVHVEGFFSFLLIIVPMTVIVITFLKRETISSQWKSISPYKYKRGEDMEYDVFLYDECDTQIFRDLFTLLQTRGYDVCSLEDITPGAFTIDTAGTFLKTSQKVIIIYSKHIITKDIENCCNIQKLHNRYFNTIKAVVKEKKNLKDIFLLCEADDNGADKLEFPDVDIPSYCYHTSHVNINNGEFIESLCKKLPKPTKK